jgi:hypothetical protein
VAEEVVGSFPFEEWAWEVRNALLGKGVAAEVSYSGPRSYPVVIDESDAEKAGEILSDIGYFTCAAPSASMGGVLDWYPMDEDATEELKDALMDFVEETVRAHAEVRAAESYSTPSDDEGNEIVIIAEFGDAVATNGDIGEMRIPKDYVLLKGRGGRIPVVEEEVDLDIVFDVVKGQEDFKPYPEVLLNELLEEIRRKRYGGRRESYVSVSGYAEYYGKGED